MSPSKPLLQLLDYENNIQTSKPMNPRGDTDALGFLEGVKVIKSLFKGHVDLISEFNKFTLKEHTITPPRETTEEKGESGEICQLLWDVLDVISQKLDFEDIFQFSGVCKNWRTFHKSNFLLPYLLVIHRGQPYCFISLRNKKFYNLKKMMTEMMTYFKFTSPIYVGYSSGYFIIIVDNSTFLLINPFTRDKKVIYTASHFKNDYIANYHGLLAFEKSSEEYVLLVLCKSYGSLHVYQSRNNGWVTYLRKGNPENSEMVVDTVVLNNIIYVVTNKGNIGVLSLNSAVIKFLNLNNTPKIIYSNLYLINRDEQLLVVGFNPNRFGRFSRVLYKINWLTMSYVELKSLDDITLFHVKGKCYKSLSNPNRWGFESNSVYEVNYTEKYSVYNWDKEWDKKYIVIEFPMTKPESSRSSGNEYDWCCNQKYEVDYSLVE